MAPTVQLADVIADGLRVFDADGLKANATLRLRYPIAAAADVLVIPHLPGGLNGPLADFPDFEQIRTIKVDVGGVAHVLSVLICMWAAGEIDSYEIIEH